MDWKEFRKLRMLEGRLFKRQLFNPASHIYYVFNVKGKKLYSVQKEDKILWLKEEELEEFLKCINQ
jgi:hypothetical protein